MVAELVLIGNFPDWIRDDLDFRLDRLQERSQRILS